MEKTIPVIDIFAGPGGLGEGFSAFKLANNHLIFKIKLSIEKDDFAHQTLELRAFYRQFTNNNVPQNYYDYLKGQITKEELYKKHPKEAFAAKKEAWKTELGEKKTNPEIVKSKIKEALNGAKDWILIGGPPCQAYSVVGRSVLRSRSKRKYATDHRHFLYKEYLKILADHQPPVFVMENVKGLLSSQRIKGKNTFDLIISDLKNPLGIKNAGTGNLLEYKLFSFSKKNVGGGGIKPEDFVVRCEKYGIPQARHRIIIFGIRSDIYQLHPETLTVEDQIKIEDVINDLPKLRSGLSKEIDSEESWLNAVEETKQAKWLKSLRDELQNAIIDASENVKTGLSRGARYIELRTKKSNKLSDWYKDDRLEGINNHESRAHIRLDLHRYFFSAVFANVYKHSPTLIDFPKELLPKHKNVQGALKTPIFNDRFRVQISGRPSTTVISHISKDGHYYIHYDPSQCRSLTVREAARLQTFPDNYFFEGNRTQQYHQVGNAVPPLLAYKIASIVYNVLLKSNK